MNKFEIGILAEAHMKIQLFQDGGRTGAGKKHWNVLPENQGRPMEAGVSLEGSSLKEGKKNSVNSLRKYAGTGGTGQNKATQGC